MAGRRKLYWWLSHLDNVGGVEMVSVLLANALEDYYDVTLIVTSEVLRSAYPVDPRIRIVSLDVPNDVTTIDQSLGIYAQEKDYKKGAKCLRSALRLVFRERGRIRKRVEEMILKDDATLIASAVDSYYLAPRKGKVYFHFHFNDRHFEDPANLFVLGLSRKPDRMIFLSEGIFRRIAARHRRAGEVGTVIANPCRYKGRKIVRKPEGRILFIGRFAAQKDPVLALKTANELKARNFPFRMSFYGTGVLLRKMERYVREHDLKDVVSINDVDEDMERIYAKSDLLLITSRYEGAPLTIPEANSFSVPIVTSDWGDGVKDAVKDGTNGAIVPGRDPKDFAARIIAVLSDEKGYRKLRESAYLESRKYALENIVPRWRKLLG